LGKISGSLRSQHLEENREDRNCTEITQKKKNMEEKGIPEKVGKKRLKTTGKRQQKEELDANREGIRRKS
jgi:hypothetical protein